MSAIAMILKHIQANTLQVHGCHKLQTLGLDIRVSTGHQQYASNNGSQVLSFRSLGDFLQTRQGTRGGPWAFERCRGAAGSI